MKTAPTVLRLLLPGLGDILWIAVFAGAILLGPQMMNIDGDLGRHLTIGEYILDTGRVPTADLFSHTMTGQPVTPHEWLSQALFALVHRWLGLNGVVLLSGLVIATSFWLVYRRARVTGGQVFPAIVFTLLAIAASSLHWLTRPHIFTFLFLALWWNVLEDMRGGRLKRWALLPVLMLLWANLHGAFIAGFATWVLYGAGLAWDAFWRRFSTGDAVQTGEELPDRFWRFYFLGGLAAALVTLANPSGLGLWATSLGYVGNSYLVGHTAEYLPPNFHDASTRPFLIFIGITVVLLGLQSRRVRASQVIPLAAWLVMALYSTRNVPLFAILAAPVLAGAAADWLEDHAPRLALIKHWVEMDRRLLTTELSLRGLLWPVVVVILIGFGLRSGAKLDFQQQGNTFDSQVFPVAAVDWLKENPQTGRVFNYFPWGGYLLYRCWPDYPVFIDGQTDFYGEALTRQYEQALTLAPGWEDVLRQYDVSWAILPAGSDLPEALRSRSGWRAVYEDETAIILVKP